MKFDLTVNLPAILTVIGALVMFVREITQIKDLLAGLVKAFDKHTVDDETNFGDIRESIEYRRRAIDDARAEAALMRERVAKLEAQRQP